MAFKWMTILGMVMALTLLSWRHNPTRSAWAASNESEVVQSESDKDGGNVETLDDLLAEVAARVPGFGGLFLGPTGTLHIYLVDERLARAAQGAIAAVFGPARMPLGNVQILPGQYSFLQLKAWHGRIIPEVLGLPGVILTDIDEGENRLRIGVEVHALQGGVEAQLVSLGIPREAVIIEETEPIEFVSHTLRSRVRSVVGGVQINFGGFLCTLGFLAVRQGVQGLMTASHCTNRQGGVENTVYHQPSASGTTNRIGLETVDPVYFIGGACPAGRRCRNSDSAFARVPHLSGPSVSVLRGRIARPTSFNTDAITISHAPANRFRIVGEVRHPVAGETLNKVGRTTGWTRGTVPSNGTCVNTKVSDTDITLLCQHFVDADVAPGDSGSPVFRTTDSPAVGDVLLYGILWGETESGTRFVFSPFRGIQAELGTLTTCDPEFSC
jgi:hypothetical protein